MLVMAKDLVSFYLEDIKEYKELEREEEIEIFKRVKNGESEAREKVILSHLKLVVNIAKKYKNTSLSLIDLISEGNLGLIYAIEKFDLKKNIRFSTYATCWIKESIYKAMKSKGRNIRIPAYKCSVLNKINKILSKYISDKKKSSEKIEFFKEQQYSLEEMENITLECQETISYDSPIGDTISLEEILTDDSYEEIEENLIKENSYNEMYEFIDELDSREKEIIRLRFGFEDSEVKTLNDIANSLHISGERVRQIEKRSIMKLRKKYFNLKLD